MSPRFKKRFAKVFGQQYLRINEAGLRGPEGRKWPETAGVLGDFGGKPCLKADFEAPGGARPIEPQRSALYDPGGGL